MCCIAVWCCMYQTYWGEACTVRRLFTNWVRGCSEVVWVLSTVSLHRRISCSSFPKSFVPSHGKTTLFSGLLSEVYYDGLVHTRLPVLVPAIVRHFLHASLSCSVFSHIMLYLRLWRSCWHSSDAALVPRCFRLLFIVFFAPEDLHLPKVPASQPENLTAFSISPSHDISYTSLNVSWETCWRHFVNALRKKTFFAALWFGGGWRSFRRDDLRAKGMHTPYPDTRIYLRLEPSKPLHLLGCAARHLWIFGSRSGTSKNTCTCAHPHMYR